MRHFKSDRHAFWLGVRDGILLFLGASVLGFGGVVLFIWLGV